MVNPKRWIQKSDEIGDEMNLLYPLISNKKSARNITEVQELAFGVTDQQARALAYKIAQSVGSQHFFNKEQERASNWWCMLFKSRYGLTLRVLENFAAY